jgi:hypothetical protein
MPIWGFVDKILCIILHRILSTKTKLACNSAGTDELSEDGTLLPKNIGAAKCNNKPIRIYAFVGYS